MEPIQKAAYNLYSEMLFLGRRSIQAIPNVVSAAEDYAEKELLPERATVGDVYEVMLAAERIVIRATRRFDIDEMQVIADKAMAMARVEGFLMLDEAPDWRERIIALEVESPTYDELYTILVLSRSTLSDIVRYELDD